VRVVRLIDIHGPELEKDERLAPLSDALLPEEHGALGGPLHGGGNGQENGREQDQGQETARDVHQALELAREPVLAFPLQDVLVEAHVEAAAAVSPVVVLGEHVEGDLDFGQLLRLQLSRQGKEDLAENPLPHLFTGIFELGEDHADDESLLVPAPHVGLADAPVEGLSDAVDDGEVRVGVDKPLDVDQHEEERLLRTLGPLALEGKHAVEIVLVVHAPDAVEDVRLCCTR